MLIDAAPFILAVSLFVFAARRPEQGLVVLLAALPLNSFVILVIGDLVGLTGLPRVALAAWHDALVGGIAVAAGVALVRAPRPARPLARLVEVLALAVMALGAVYVVVAPYTLTALYAYRALYEPVLLMLALLVLAHIRGLAGWLPRRAALAMVGGGLIAALAAWPQVYLGGFHYLDVFYHEPGDTLDAAYVGTALAQPRAVGTFFAPNEFGAYLAVVVGILAQSRITGLRPVVRAWLLVPILLALVLSFSRSGWVTTAVILVVTSVLAIRAHGKPALRLAALRGGRAIASYGPPVATGLVLLVAIVLSSHANDFLDRTISGTDPSAGGRPQSAVQGAKTVSANPLGVGLGMAGPKSTRFGEMGDKPVLASETWYVAYAMQVGIGGLLLLLAFVAATARELWRGVRHPWPILALAVMAGLGTGALFIPVIDDPNVETPLLAIIALALVTVRGGLGDPAIREASDAAAPAGT